MTKERYVSHGADLNDAIGEIKDLRYPYMLITTRMPPQKEHGDEYEKKRKLQAYFFRSVAKTYADCAGIDEVQARYELQSRYLRVGEVVRDESGKYDIVWLDGDVFNSFEQGKIHSVISIGDLSNAELIEFIDKSKNYILITYGVACPEYVREYKTREI